VDAADYVILAVLAFGAFDGYRSGFVRQLVRLFGTVVAYVAAWKFSFVLMPFATHFVSTTLLRNANAKSIEPVLGLFGGDTTANVSHAIAQALAFGAVFVIALILVRYLGHLLNALMHLPLLSQLNRMLGLVAGLVVAFVVLAIAINVVAYIPSPLLKSQIRHSSLAPVFSAPVAQLTRIEGIDKAHPRSH
jgi:uncharacterized membrane protein required for colicin V production